MTRLLLVEDDSGIASPLTEYLKKSGFEVGHAPTLSEATRLMHDCPQVVILDWTLPDGDGLDWLKAQRASGYAAPVLMLTSRTDMMDKVLGLELGASDYLTKPFEPRELLARLRAQLRLHSGDAVLSADSKKSPILASGGIEMNEVTRDVLWKGKPVPLTRMEFALLKVFLENPRRVFSRDELLDTVWGLKYPTTRTVDVHVNQLRQKFAADLFETLHGVGYRFLGT
jgi:DNA-binding response OmpR family regulator